MNLEKALLLIACLFFIKLTLVCEEITPHKYQSTEETLKSSYVIPSSSRFTVQRGGGAPDIVYYFSRPKNTISYPIALLCGGSTTKDAIGSIIHFHRYFLKEFLSLKVAVITLEQWGVDGKQVNEAEFWAHYTRSQRLKDHCTVIEHLKEHPPSGWNGKLIFLGASEGGLLVTTLTELYSDSVLATINWCGAGDWPWHKELWSFIQAMRRNSPWWFKLWELISAYFFFSSGFPQTEEAYEELIEQILSNPTIDKEFLGMTYFYHTDALLYPDHNYQKLKTPLLVVAGAQDSIVLSSDSFVQKAKTAGCPITYLRIEDMDHYIRTRPDIIEQSFEWLRLYIKQSPLPFDSIHLDC
jgi:pimeloyl-ACP methyl ester carboxylesterase